MNSMLRVPFENKQMLSDLHSDLFDVHFNMFMDTVGADILNEINGGVTSMTNILVMNEFAGMVSLLKSISRDSLEMLCGVLAAIKIHRPFVVMSSCAKIIKLCNPYAMYCNPLEQKYGKFKGYNMANPVKSIDAYGKIHVFRGFGELELPIEEQMKIGMMMRNLILLFVAKNRSSRRSFGNLPNELFRELKTFLI
jgi:hypothetical protein